MVGPVPTVLCFEGVTKGTRKFEQKISADGRLRNSGSLPFRLHIHYIICKSVNFRSQQTSNPKMVIFYLCSMTFCFHFFPRSLPGDQPGAKIPSNFYFDFKKNLANLAKLFLRCRMCLICT